MACSSLLIEYMVIQVPDTVYHLLIPFVLKMYMPDIKFFWLYLCSF